MRTVSRMPSTTTRRPASSVACWKAGRARLAGRRCSTAPARTFRMLPEKDQAGVTEKKAIALMLEQPSMIKRPVLDVGGRLLVGFKPEQYAKTFGAA